MIAVRLMGGLGNQLFQYATGWALSQLQGQELLIDTRFYRKYQLHGGYKLNHFGIQVVADMVRLNRHFPEWKIWGVTHFPRLGPLIPWLVTENGQVHLSEIIGGHTHRLLLGYWQNAAFFQHCRSDLLTQFQLVSKTGAAYERFVDLIHAVSDPVAVHIRRGDYLSNPDALRVHGICAGSYYMQSLQQLATHLDHPLAVFIFTDDPEWVKHSLVLPPETIASIVHVVGTTAEEDLMLMRTCHHHVIANSTFSWWGAWLSQATDQQQVFAPRPWFDASQLEARSVIVPSNWKRVDKS